MAAPAFLRRLGGVSSAIRRTIYAADRRSRRSVASLGLPDRPPVGAQLTLVFRYSCRAFFSALFHHARTRRTPGAVLTNGSWFGGCSKLRRHMVNPDADPNITFLSQRLGQPVKLAGLYYVKALRAERQIRRTASAIRRRSSPNFFAIGFFGGQGPALSFGKHNSRQRAGGMVRRKRLGSGS